MHARRYLTLLLPVLLCVGTLGASAVTAQPATAGLVAGTVTDQYNNRLRGIIVEALDGVTGVPCASGTTADAGDFSMAVETPSATYKIRVSDPAEVFTTTYLWGRESFDDAYVFGCT